ncbi:hypothetical protein TA3x_004067 [Tundrisphaera sp. TA3]|uniref:hypothetical protein n=1 Tax=Tundrisphaera sp. TA3 TaxID=3435775 RepID=UPI003EBAE496
MSDEMNRDRAADRREFHRDLLRSGPAGKPPGRWRKAKIAIEDVVATVFGRLRRALG